MAAGHGARITVSAVPRIARALAALLVTGCTIVAVTSAASGTTVQDTPYLECTGTIAHTRIDRTVLVPADGICELDHVLVTGDLVLADGARYTRVASSEVRGQTFLGRGTDLATDAVTLADVVLADAWAVNLERATVRGDVRGTARIVGVLRTLVTGAVVVRPGDDGSGDDPLVDIRRTTVRGGVDADGFQFFGADLTVAGDLSVVDPTVPYFHFLAGSLCDIDVAGDVRIERSEWIFVFAAHPWGDPILCDPVAQRSTIGGSLVVVDNRHSIAVAGVTVAGDLVCTGNTGPRGVLVARDVVVSGARVGQCA